MKRTILMIVAAVAVSGYAISTTFAGTTKAPGTKVAKASPKMENSQLMIAGATAANRAEIEKYAKAQGAHHASLNVKTGELKISTMEGKPFNKDAFAKELTDKVPGASVK